MQNRAGQEDEGGPGKGQRVGEEEDSGEGGFEECHGAVVAQRRGPAANARTGCWVPS